MSTLQSYTSGTRPSASSNSGLCIFRSDTNNIEVSDGTDWLAYASDGITFGDNSYVAELNGTDQYLTLGDVSGTLGGVSKCTVSWWMKKPSGSTTNDRWHMDQASLDNLCCLWDNGNSWWAIIVGDGDGTFTSLRTNAISIDDNDWHLWTMVYDGTQSTTTDRIELYKDTSLLTTVAYGGGGAIASSLPSTTGDAPTVGAYYNGTQAQFYSNASFDDFAIFNDALTASQISNIYNNQIYPSSSLKHLYRMENNVNDSVGSANGTQVNSPITNSPSTPSFPY